MLRQDVLNKAKSQEAVSESPANNNKSPYGLWYDPKLNGQKWCAMFVSWVFHHAGHPLGNIQGKNGIHHCQSVHNYYKEKGTLTASPESGDIVKYDWECIGHADHIGIFINWTNADPTAIEAWEGNTSTSNNSDGGSVMKRTRSLNLIKSFINPGVYDEPAITEAVPLIGKGSRGSKVVQIQKYLYELGYTVEIDCWFGDQTETIIKEYQTKNVMVHSHFVDVVTIGALQDANQSLLAKSKFVSGSYLRRGNLDFMVTELQRGLNINIPN